MTDLTTFLDDLKIRAEIFNRGYGHDFELTREVVAALVDVAKAVIAHEDARDELYRELAKGDTSKEYEIKVPKQVVRDALDRLAEVAEAQR